MGDPGVPWSDGADFDTGFQPRPPLQSGPFRAHVTLSEAKGLAKCGWQILGEVNLAGTNTKAASSSKYESIQAPRSIPMKKILFTVAGLLVALAVACSGGATSQPTGGATVTSPATTVPKIATPTQRPVQEWRLDGVSVEDNTVTVMSLLHI